MENGEMTNIELFLNTYHKVFDKNDNIMPCGRDVTKKLIGYAKDVKAGIDFGNTDTGIMVVENIKALYGEMNK
jgi:hypothetical protein